MEYLTLIVLSAFSLIIIVTSAPKPRARTESEKYYLSAHLEKRLPLPDISDEPTCNLSVVVPAYNETERLPSMLRETVDYLENKRLKDPIFQYEIIVVDDGSTDGTSKTALKYGQTNSHVDLKVLTLEKNRNKGGAVTQGILSSRGKTILFADADGATKFSDHETLERRLLEVVDNNGFGVAIGSRAHLVNTEVVVKRSFIRNFLMHSFHKVLYILGIRAIKDTQCGFKLFTRKSASYIFHNMHVEGWIFDIEVLLIAQYFNMPIVEVPVTWHEIDGSKMSLIKDSIRMAIDLLTIRLCYLSRYWNIREPLPRLKRD
ncbi:glycosyltransferase family 2 protein [Gigaspora rosea]|uniref:dolichyl-phosphate beta-glucosyltransferase n=1 Tax=Gigaspora rosea TaxID=44941 RepID=A0A397W1J9_9GLOM|nr:glycosyltransferase family 2 protein [Gigaspora rosea]